MTVNINPIGEEVSNMKRIFGFIAMMLFTLALCVAPAMAADSDTGSAGTDEYTVSQAEHQAIVCVRTQDQGATLQAQSADGLSWEPLMDVTGVSTAATQKADSLTTQGNDGKELMLVKSDSLSTDEIIAAVQARGDVIFAEPNHVYTLKDVQTQTADTSQIVNETKADYSRFQWGNANTGLVDKGKTGVDIGNTTGLTGSKSTVIAVMDTGIDYTHPDLQDQMVNLDAYPALEAATNCGKYGYCGVSTESASDIYDYALNETHGTHIAGIIAATANGTGTNGLMKNVSLMGIRNMTKDGSILDSATLNGYDFLVKAREAGVNVKAVNCSFGGMEIRQGMELAIQKAGEAGVTSIYASGNSNVNTDDNIFSTESSVTSGAAKIVVDSDTASGTRSAFSNYGVMSTDVFAPGTDILSTVGALNAQFNAFLAAQDADRIVSYNGFESDASGTAEPAVNPMTFCAWSDTAADNCGDSMSGSTSYAFLGDSSLKMERPATGDTTTVVTKPMAITKDAARKLYIGGLLECENNAVTNAAQVAVSFRKADGSYTAETNWRARTTIWANNYMEIPSDASLDHFQVKLTVTYLSDTTKALYMDSFGLGYGLERYSLMSGTSMAAPMAAGVYGLLASEYPDEPAAKIAARVIGSATATDDLKDLCRSGGYVNTAKGAADPNPVVQKIAVDGQKAVLTGYFFGDKGSVTVGGKTAAVTSWSDTSITLTLPTGISAMQEFKVTDSAGQSGRNYANVGNVANTYTDLTIPSGGQYDATTKVNMAAVGNKIYMLTSAPELWCYDIQKAAWEDLGTSITADGNTLNLSEGMGFTACSGKLCFFTGDNLYQWEPSGGTLEKTALTLNSTFYRDGTLADVNGQLMYFGGMTQYAATSTAEKGILTIDRKTGAVTKTGEMPVGLIAPKVAESNGTVMILGGATAMTGGMKTKNTDVYKTTDLKTFTACDALPGDDGQEAAFAVAPTKTGLIMAGMIHQADGVWQDTWNLDASTGKWTASDKILSVAKTFAQAGCQVNDKFYVWGQSTVTDKLTFFRSTDIESPAAAPSVTYEVHGRNYGWDQGWKADGATAGTTGQALRLEALKVKIEGEDGLGISYQVHVQNKGWMEAAADGAMAGTTGQSLRMEAVKISLTGANAGKYSVSYRVHVQNKGWTDWAKDGAEAGTTGLGLRAEAIEIKLTAK